MFGDTMTQPMQSEHLPCVARCSLCAHRLSLIGFIFICACVFVCVRACVHVCATFRLQPKPETRQQRWRAFKENQMQIGVTDGSTCADECDRCDDTSRYSGVVGASGPCLSAELVRSWLMTTSPCFLV